MSERAPDPDSIPSLEAVILDLCARAERGRTINPTDAAQAFADLRNEGAMGWRRHLQNVRTASIKLAAAGQVVIYRKGKPADPHDFRGVYRLGAPNSE